MALATIPTTKGEAVPETEPNDVFPGQAATVGTTFTGSLSGSDFIDFFRYTGLSAGDLFDLTFTATDIEDPADRLRAGLYSDGTTILSSVFSNGSTVHLTGTAGGSQLVFGITKDTAFGFEGYSLSLTTRHAAVPEPATIVLLAAGLTAAGLGAARRRKRS